MTAFGLGSDPDLRCKMRRFHLNEVLRDFYRHAELNFFSKCAEPNPTLNAPVLNEILRFSDTSAVIRFVHVVLCNEVDIALRYCSSGQIISM